MTMSVVLQHHTGWIEPLMSQITHPHLVPNIYDLVQEEIVPARDGHSS